MNDTNAPAAAAGTPGTPPGAPGSNAGQGGTPEAGAARPDDTKRDDIERRLAGLSAVVGKLREQVEKIAKGAAAGGEPGPGKGSDAGLTQKIADLEDRVRRLGEREQRLREQASVAMFARALRENGVSDALAERYARLLVRVEQAGKIRVEEEENGGYRVEVLDGDGLPVSVDRWVAAYLKTDEGLALLPPTRNPAFGGAPLPPAHGIRVVTRDDLMAGRVSIDDLRQGRVRIVE